MSAPQVPSLRLADQPSPPGIGHAHMMFERLQHLHNSMKARGASAEAMARLPKLPYFEKPTNLRAVLGIKPRSTSYITAAARLLAPSQAHTAEVKAEGIDARKPWYRGLTDPQEMARAKAIAGVVAEALQLEPWQLMGGGRSYRLVLPRHIAITLIADLTPMSSPRIGKMFNLSDATSSRYAIQKVRWLLKMQDARAVLFHTKALAAIRLRWPEYAEAA